VFVSFISIYLISVFLIKISHEYPLRQNECNMLS
jgi:hypothetical protein